MASPGTPEIDMRGPDAGGVLESVTDHPRRRLKMSAVLAMSAFPVLTLLLMALARAEESLTHSEPPRTRR
jgi:hypothetical protein